MIKDIEPEYDSDKKSSDDKDDDSKDDDTSESKDENKPCDDDKCAKEAKRLNDKASKDIEKHKDSIFKKLDDLKASIEKKSKSKEEAKCESIIMPQNPDFPGVNKQIVVCESGKNKNVIRSDFDIEFDKTTARPGEFYIEKCCSGAYLGPVSLIMLKTAAKEEIFSPYVCKKILELISLSSLLFSL